MPVTPAGNALVVVSDVESYIGLSSPAQADVDLLQTWINLLSDYVEKRCGNKIVQTTIASEVRDGDETDTIYPQYFPIQSIAGADDPSKLANVQSRGNSTAMWTNIASYASQLFIDPERPWAIQLLDNLVFPRGTKNIRLSYVCGFATVPGDLQTMMFEMLQTMWDESKAKGDQLRKNSIVMNEANGSATVTFKDMRPVWTATILRYGRLFV